MYIRKTAAALLLLFAPLTAGALDTGRIPQNEIAVYVQELDSGKVIIDHRADVAVNPASTMKLVTAFAAFKTFGNAYRWTTDFKSDGKIDDQTLNGNLYWVGSGDPVFDQKDLLAAQQQLRDKGIRYITGHLVLDRQLWGIVGDPENFEHDSGSPFMTAPHPNMLASNLVKIRAERDASGNIAVITDPPLPDLAVSHTVKTVPSKSAVCPSVKKLLHTAYSGNTLKVSGTIPENCLGKDTYARLFTMDDFIRRSFINHWQQSGSTISDGIETGNAPAQARVLASVRSKPMKDILTDMNKHSDNLIARSVFLKLGGAGNAEQAAQQSASRVRQELAVAGIDVDGLILENGSGLSRKERVTAKMMAQMLEKAYFSPFGKDFIDTLPIAGEDGTLRNRLKNTGGMLRLKTGTLNNVRALAGYWLGNKPMVIVVIINSGRAVSYLPDLDKLVSRTLLPGGDEWLDAHLLCKERRRA